MKRKRPTVKQATYVMIALLVAAACFGPPEIRSAVLQAALALLGAS